MPRLSLYPRTTYERLGYERPTGKGNCVMSLTVPER